ncbi:MAG: PDZ domain-containing protein [Xanthomonadales bacterium]|nr:PDZ domain-containing protein [Xanthomonadales bacterium]NIN60507.1 PDZ domain-containing protein [Xanthomonadales bacterium]NIN75862.1 PDZ domain-containing protein [Xanthomonadales bacterium]NIO15252.1 PDZ domain-containing protein [Xanthomonadales bacterium]NIP12900.1 PDZ domain-containing protein [Xanthomonadales bacterium]
MTLDDLRTFTDVFNQVRGHYVEEIGDRALIHAAIEGLVTGLDPYSQYLSPAEFRDLDDSSRGRYAGIGVTIEIREQRIHVDSVVVDGPAQRAGLQAGDLITAVNGRPVKGRNLREAVNELRGPPGSEVEVEYLRRPDAPTTVVVTREYITVNSVASERVAEHFGYFRISHFNEHSAADLQAAIEDVQQGGGQPLRGIVLDLRANPGGNLKPAIDIADGFLTEGRIMHSRGRFPAAEMTFEATPGEWAQGVPMAVLVDRQTASASEVLAGALQDHQRARIVGERTFGKGSVQSILALRNGGGLKLTTAHYFTPLGRSIQDTGIHPDLEVDAQPDEAGMADPALNGAIEWLQGETG